VHGDRLGFAWAVRYARNRGLLLQMGE